MDNDSLLSELENLKVKYDEKVECLAIMCAINEKLVNWLNTRQNEANVNHHQSQPTQRISNNSPVDDMYIPAGGSDPSSWSVKDVYDFVFHLPGCQEYAEEFRAHEIDGQALMLLKAENLVNAMSMKLGPALKICSRINQLLSKAQS